MSNHFYVYEHWRPDTGTCFYVGKGKGVRAYKFDRPTNTRYNRVRDKLFSTGLLIEVRIFSKDLLEKDALALEIERIAYWRSVGCPIVNLTDGGEGSSGFYPSAETRAKRSAAQLGKKESAETKEKKEIKGPTKKSASRGDSGAYPDQGQGSLGRSRILQTHERGPQGLRAH